MCVIVNYSSVFGGGGGVKVYFLTNFPFLNPRPPPPPAYHNTVPYVST